MSRIHRFTGQAGDYRWEGAVALSTDDPATRGVSGQRMIGDADGTPNFHFRYFCVEPGGYTFLHRHAHDHGIMILHGRATVVIEDQTFEVGPRDIVYIGPHDLHQLRASGDEPLGFLCVIDPHAVEPD